MLQAMLRPAVDIINLRLDKYFLCSDGIFYSQRSGWVFNLKAFFVFMLTPCYRSTDGGGLDKVEI